MASSYRPASTNTCASILLTSSDNGSTMRAASSWRSASCGVPDGHQHSEHEIVVHLGQAGIERQRLQKRHARIHPIAIAAHTCSRARRAPRPGADRAGAPSSAAGPSLGSGGMISSPVEGRESCASALARPAQAGA